MASPRSILIRFLTFLPAIALLMAIAIGSAQAYSVITHEELIDLAWDGSIKPLLLARFPGASEEQLREAHAYAYGGSAIQDMGYYPFGKKFFSNLTHYARTGDFVSCLLREARTIDELAFAIGALSHYLGDSIGHAQVINPATAIEFPQLERRFGRSVTYGESPHGHIRTEFAFDIGELTNAQFAPLSYLRHIGFQTPRKFLERAFADTYGFDIHEVLGRAHPALRSYRTSVRAFIPAFAQAEVVLHRRQFPAPADDEAYRIFAGRVERTNYFRQWKHAGREDGFRAHLLAVLVFIIPKIGPASDLAIKIPTVATEHRYFDAVNHTVDAFSEVLRQLQENHEQDGVAIPDVDLDTGRGTRRGDYPLADETYAQLVERLAARPQRTIPEALKKNILAFYADSTQANPMPEHLPEQLTIVTAMRTKESAR